MKFRLKLTLCMLCLMALLFGVGGSAMISISFETSLLREKKTAHESYQMLLNTLQVVNKMEKWTGAGDVTEVLSQLIGKNTLAFHALRIAASEGVFYESGDATMFSAAQQQETAPAYCLITVYPTEHAQYLRLSGAFVMDEETFYLDALRDITLVYAMLEQQKSDYQKIYLCLVAVCALLTYSVAWLLTRPLVRLSRAAKAIASGDLSFRSALKTRDEIGILSAEFDHMAAKTEQNVLELQNAMERQTRFTRSFTHELKTPMASIIGYADLLRCQTLSLEEQAEAAHYIFKAGKRLENLSIRLLEIFVTEQEAVVLREIAIAALIGQVVSARQVCLNEKGIDVSIRCDNGICRAEPDLLWTLIDNLVDNAQKALEPGGKIAISSATANGCCTITVSDTGRGIPEEALSHITEAFYRVTDKTHGRGQGAGLGLALCAKIVELHNGTMTFSSSVGVGTCVTVNLKGGASCGC